MDTSFKYVDFGGEHVYRRYYASASHPCVTTQPFFFPPHLHLPCPDNPKIVKHRTSKENVKSNAHLLRPKDSHPELLKSGTERIQGPYTHASCTHTHTHTCVE